MSNLEKIKYCCLIFICFFSVFAVGNVFAQINNVADIQPGWLVKNIKYAEVFFVDTSKVLRWIVNEETAKKQFGVNWNQIIKEYDDLSTSGLKFGDEIKENDPLINQPSVDTICSTASVFTKTLVKTYHLLDLTDGFNVMPAKDGGYFLMGDTLPAAGMGAAKPFIIKTDAKGNILWSRWSASPSAALGSMSSRRRGRLVAETTDGNIVMANDMMDFVDDEYAELKEEYGDIFITKLNANGNLLWSVMLGDYGLDRPKKIWTMPGGSVMIFGLLSKTGYGSDIADSDTVPKYSAFIKVDKNGKVLMTKKMDWSAEDIQSLSDGSYIALANINVTKTEAAELIPHALPTIIKLDSNLNQVWAKSLEMIPSSLSTPTSNASGGLTITKTAIRMPGGDFRSVQPTPDGGFIAIGFGDLTLNSGLITGLGNQITSFTPRSLIATKVDSAGNYQWTKKLATNLTSSSASNDFQVVKTTDSQFVIMQDVARDSATVQSPDFKLQPEALASNIELIKTDADFNPRWVKKIDIERDLSGYGIAPTTDKGVVISASLLTTKQHMVLGSLEPYKEATLIKVDANGNANSCVNVSNQPYAAVEDQSQYLVMKNMIVGSTADIKLNINKSILEKITTIGNVARSICLYKEIAVKPLCSYLTLNLPDSTLPVAKTWAQINYDNTKEVAVQGDKNISTHSELLPELNRLFNNQVKVKDSMKSMWLTYVFPRLVTRADVESVQKFYADRGYKIEESDGGTLWVSRVGLTLHLTFSIQNSMAGKLEVLF